MLSDLFSRELVLDVTGKSLKGNDADAVEFVRVMHLFTGLASNEPTESVNDRLVQERWGDAEGFLERLEAAAEDPESTAGRRVARLLQQANSHECLRLLSASVPDQKKALQSTRDAARSLLRLQCTLFTSDLDLQSERCQPYKTWAKFVSDDVSHRVLTFNYDSVPECVGLKVPLPHEIEDVGDGHPGVVFKLHGSVFWWIQDDASHPNGAIVFSRVDGAGMHPAIAVPGANKRKLVKTHLAQLWGRAVSEIERADVVVFVGYRFPPSDSESLMRLVNALKANRSRRLVVNTVLGPHTGDDDSVRLARLIEYALRQSGRELRSSRQQSFPASNGEVRIHPLWAQDFLTLWSPDLTSW